MNQALHFADGALTAGFLILALFFLKFWHRTRDGFFALFAAAFALLAANAVGSALSGAHSEDTNPSIYLLRLFAFVLIIVAIVRKNVETRPKSKSRWSDRQDGQDTADDAGPTLP